MWCVVCSWFITSQLFDVVRKDSPDALERIIPLEGDISQAGLGISNEDTQTITDRVSVVFHLAANINFNAPLTDALQFNVLGVREMVRLAKKMKKLQVNRYRLYNFTCVLCFGYSHLFTCPLRTAIVT